jgi:hypothetical protein
VASSASGGYPAARVRPVTALAALLALLLLLVGCGEVRDATTVDRQRMPFEGGP